MRMKASVLLNIILTTTLLASILFSAFTEKTTSVEYDPWLDYNDDGTVDMKDIYATIRAYGSEGDPTKNVTVTNFPKSPEPKIITVVQNCTVTATEYGETTFIASANVTGYGYASIFVAYHNDDSDENLIYGSSCLGIVGLTYALNLHENGYHETGAMGYMVRAPELHFEVYSYQPGTIELTIVLYCYN